MNVQEITKKFIENPSRMTTGAGSLAKQYKCSIEDIYAARQAARSKASIFSPSIPVDSSIYYVHTILDNLVSAESEYYEVASYVGNPIKDKFNSGDKVLTPGIHIVMGCVHVPFQNRKMQEGVIELIKDLGNKVTGFHLIGDVLDMNSLSSHDQGKKPIDGITLAYEYEEGNLYLDSFEKVLPKNIDKIWVSGNHEARYNTFISNTSNMKYSSAVPSPQKALDLDRRGYKVLTDWKEDYYYLGNSLQLFHGEFYGQHPAMQHMKRSNSSVMFVHSHRVSTYIENGLEGYNIGWGGDVTSPAFNYASRFTKQNWQNAFSIVTLDNQGNSHVETILVKNNRFYYNGKIYGS